MDLYKIYQWFFFSCIRKNRKFLEDVLTYVATANRSIYLQLHLLLKYR